MSEELAAVLTQPTGLIADAETSMSFAEVAEAAAEIAAQFGRFGLTEKDCISFGCDNSVASAVVLIALLASGHHFVLRTPTDMQARKSLSPPVAETFCRFALEAGRQGRAGGDDGAVTLRAAGVSLSLEVKTGWRANLPPGPPSFLLATSGSTGAPKLVRHAQDRLLPGSRICADRLALSSSDRVAIPVPLAHMYGLQAAFIPALVAGAAIDLQANANALQFLAREEAFSPTVAFLTPGFGQTLMAVRKSSRRYRLSVFAGDDLSADEFDAYEARHGCVVKLYGSTELGAVAIGVPGDPVDLRRSRIGPLVAGARLSTDRPASQDPAASGGPDVLWFSHRAGFLGYVDPSGRAIRGTDGVRPSGDRHCSGDLGALDDGYLTVLGRIDDRVKRDGLFVACADVARAMRGIDGLARIVVFAGERTRRGRALVACVVPQVAGRWDPVSLRKACLDVLPPPAVPDRILLLPEMPLLATGKVDRRALRRLYETGET